MLTSLAKAVKSRLCFRKGRNFVVQTSENKYIHNGGVGMETQRKRGVRTRTAHLKDRISHFESKAPGRAHLSRYTPVRSVSRIDRKETVLAKAVASNAEIFEETASGQGHTVVIRVFFYELPHERRTTLASQDRLAFQSRTFRGGVTLKPYPTRSARVLTCCPP